MAVSHKNKYWFGFPGEGSVDQQMFETEIQ